MDKFDIHKWQREAYTAVNENDDAGSSNILDFNKPFPHDDEINYELGGLSDENGSFQKVINCIKDESLDDVQEKYLARYVAHHFNSILRYESHKLEEAGNDERMKDLLADVIPLANKFIDSVRKKGKLKELEIALTAAETELNIDIPDTPEEANNISKAELERIGKVKDLIENQELGENLEDLEKTVRNLLAKGGLLFTVVGALAKVSGVVGAAPLAGVGVFFMAVSILLTHYKNGKDENLQQEEVDPSEICPKCELPFLVSDIFGLYSICILCGFDSIGN